MHGQSMFLDLNKYIYLNIKKSNKYFLPDKWAIQFEVERKTKIT